MTEYLYPHITVAIGDDPAEVKVDGGRLTLDAGSVPYAEAQVDLPLLPVATLLETLDPREDTRVVVAAANTGAWGPSYTAWTETRRQLCKNPRPTVYPGGWTGGGTGAISGEWVVFTHGGATTAFVWTATCAEHIRVGDVVSFRATFRIDSVGSPAVTHLSCRAHKRTGNMYFHVQSVPVTIGAEQEVTWTWTATADCPANDLDISLVPSNSVGGAFTTQPAGFTWRVRRPVIERGPAAGPFFDGNSSADGYTPWVVTRSNLMLEPNPATAAKWPTARLTVSFVADAGGNYAHGVVNATGGPYYNLTSATNRTAASPGRPVSYAVDVRTGEGSAKLTLYFMDAAGAYLPGGIQGPDTPADTAWHTATVSGIAPAGAAFAGVYVFKNTTGTLGSSYLDARRALATAAPGEFFDGSTADSALVAYSWRGAVNASESVQETREPGPTAELAQYRWTGAPADSASVQEQREPVLGWIPDPPRLFDLGLRSREIDHVTQKVRVLLASDEALLTDYAVLLEDPGPRAHEASLRAVVNYALAKVGAVLEAGGPDADVTAAWSVRNLIRNPRAAVNLDNWVTATTGASLARVATGGPDGGPRFLSQALTVNSIGMFYTGTGAVTTIAESEIRVQEGQRVRFSMRLTTGQAGTGAVSLRLRFSNGIRHVDAVGPSHTPVLNDAYPRIEMTAVVPPGMTSVAPWIGSPVGAAWPVNSTLSMGQILLVVDEEVIPFFDGATPADARYRYKWDGDANAATSTREPITPRPRELFVWKPGTTAWDFLQPLLTPSGLRLFCDEHRVWRMVDPGEYAVPGMISIAGHNAAEGADTISRANTDVFATGVVARYLWEDSKGVPQVAYDTAGTPGRVFTIDYHRPFPGPGAAAAILTRRDGTGRTQDVSALADWLTTPGMVASITLPATPEQQGKVAEVEFSLGDDALMDVGTRGLIDIPPGSWAATDPAEAWTDPPDITWAQWT